MAATPAFCDGGDKCVAALTSPEKRKAERRICIVRKVKIKQRLCGQAAHLRRVGTDVVSRAVPFPVGVKIDDRQVAEHRRRQLVRAAAAFGYHAYRAPEVELLAHVHPVERPLHDLKMPVARAGVPQNALKPVGAGMSCGRDEKENRFHQRPTAAR